MAVEEINNPPLIVSEGAQTVYAGENVTLSSTVLDPDNDALTYLWMHDAAPGLGLTIADLTTQTLRFEAPPVATATTIVFTITADDGLLTVTAQMVVNVRVAIDSGALLLLAPDTLTQRLNGSIYAIVPGRDADGAVLNASVLVADAALAVCVVPGLEVEIAVVLDVAVCDAAPVALTEAAALQVPNFGSVLYFIEPDTAVIDATQQVYVAPSIGFVASMQTAASMVTLNMQGPVADAPYLVDLAFTGTAGPTRRVRFDANAAMPTRAQVVVMPVADIVTLASVNGITFTGSGSDELMGLEAQMLFDQKLFTLGNRSVGLILPADTGSPIVRDAGVFPVDPGAPPAEITFTDTYPVEVFVRSTTATQGFVPLLASTQVRSVRIGGDGNVALLDAAENVVASASVSLFLPILQLHVGTTVITVFGSTLDMIGLDDRNSTLAQGAMLLPGSYVSSDEDAQASARVSTATASVLNLPALPDARPAMDTDLFDFIVELDQAEDVAVIVLTLDTAAPVGSRYYKYREDTAEWVLFDTSGNDRIYSAPLPCPPAGARREPDSGGVWHLAADAIRAADQRCLLLEIHDGSTNDADGRVNGYVVDLGALVVPMAGDGNGGGDGGGDVASGGGGGGGAIGMWLLLLASVAMIVALSRRMRRVSWS